MTATGRLTLQDVAKSFGATEALAGVSLEIEPGEVLAVTGPSGAGKTTLCRLVSGLELPDRGTLALGGADLAGVPAEKRRISYLFESYALFPHLTVFENVASPLRVPGRRSLAASELGERVQTVLATLAIDHLHARLPSELSGGQKQRVGLARALVQDDASVTLLDEPISHLDAKLRHRLRGEIKRSLAARTAPAVWSTPDGLEALSVGDRVAVLIGGRLEQIGTPQEVWERPASVRVARLLGDPPMSLLDGELSLERTAGLIVGAGARLPLPADLTERLRRAAGGAAVTLGIKPRALGLGPPDAGLTSLEIETVEPFGKHTIVSLRLGAAQVRAKVAGTGSLKPGEIVGLRVDPAGVMVFDGRTGAALELPPEAREAEANLQERATTLAGS